VSQRKGVVVVLVLIAAAMLVSLGGLLFIAALAGGAGAPAVARNSTLVVRVGGTLEELEPRGLAGQFLAPRCARRLRLSQPASRPRPPP